MKQLGVIAGDNVTHSLRRSLLGHPITLAWWGSALEECETGVEHRVVVELSRAACGLRPRLPDGGRVYAGIAVDEDSWTIAQRLGIDVVLASPEDLLSWLDTDQEPFPPEGLSPVTPGRIITVYGPHGAPGVTSTAVNLAARVSQSRDGVVVVDANTYSPSLDLAVAISAPGSGLVQASRLARIESVTAATLLAQAREYRGERSLFRVFTGIPDARHFADVDAESLRRVLHTLRDDGSLVILDCAPPCEVLIHEVLGGPMRNAATRVCLEEADALVVVTTASPIHLERLIRAWPEASSLASRAATIPVVNRVPRGARGVLDEVTDALWQLSGIGDLVAIPEDAPAVARAMQAGATVVDAAPASPIHPGLDAVISRAGLGEGPRPKGGFPRARRTRSQRLP